MKVLSIVGNRPQFIKSAPLSLALRDAGIEEVTLHTGQHYDRELSQVFFDELRLAEPRYRLAAGSGALGAQAADVPLVHVEAGLRSGDLSMPEERNRIAVDRIAALLLAPDERSA